jgi:hypothetical protein
MSITETAVPKGIAPKFAWLLSIYEQVKQANAGNEATRSVGKQLDKSSTAVNDNAELIAEVVSELSGQTLTTDEVYSLATILGQYADYLAPKSASTLWKSESVTGVVAYIQGAINVEEDDLSDEERTVFADMVTEMSKGSGSRSRSDTPVETIEGRPTKVQLFDSKGNEIGKGYSGNTRASAGNIATRVASLTSVEKSNETEYAVIRAHANKVVDKDNTEDVTYKGVTMRPVYETE